MLIRSINPGHVRCSSQSINSNVMLIGGLQHISAQTLQFGSQLGLLWPYLSHQRKTCEAGPRPATSRFRQQLLWLAYLKEKAVLRQALAFTDSFNCLKHYKAEKSYLSGKCAYLISLWTISLGNTALGKLRQLAPFRTYWDGSWANFKRHLGLMWSFEGLELELGTAFKDSEIRPLFPNSDITIGVSFYSGRTYFAPVWI